VCTRSRQYQSCGGFGQSVVGTFAIKKKKRKVENAN
jgi:hypothetical protein